MLRSLRTGLALFATGIALTAGAATVTPAFAAPPPGPLTMGEVADVAGPTFTLSLYDQTKVTHAGRTQTYTAKVRRAKESTPNAKGTLVVKLPKGTTLVSGVATTNAGCVAKKAPVHKKGTVTWSGITVKSGGTCVNQLTLKVAKNVKVGSKVKLSSTFIPNTAQPAERDNDTDTVTH